MNELKMLIVHRYKMRFIALPATITFKLHDRRADIADIARSGRGVHTNCTQDNDPREACIGIANSYSVHRILSLRSTR